MIVFISGAMTGHHNMNRHAFYKAQKMLERNSMIVLNPAWYPDDMKHEQYLHMCRAMIDVADAVYVLRGSENSRGSKEEVEYAHSLGKVVIYQYETMENHVLKPVKSE